MNVAVKIEQPKPPRKKRNHAHARTVSHQRRQRVVARQDIVSVLNKAQRLGPQHMERFAPDYEEQLAKLYNEGRSKKRRK